LLLHVRVNFDIFTNAAKSRCEESQQTLPCYYAALHLTKARFRGKVRCYRVISWGSLIAAGVSSVEELRSFTVWLCQYATYLLRNLQQAAISSASDIAPVSVNRAGTTYM